MHAKHETRLAELTGTVVITGATTLTVDEADVVVGPGQLDGPRITHYHEVNVRP